MDLIVHTIEMHSQEQIPETQYWQKVQTEIKTHYGFHSMTLLLAELASDRRERKKELQVVTTPVGFHHCSLAEG